MGRPARPDDRHGALRPAERSDLRWLYVVEGIVDGFLATDPAIADHFAAWAEHLTLTQESYARSTAWLLSRAADLVRERIRVPTGTRSVIDRLAFGLHARFLTPFSRERDVRLEPRDEREYAAKGPPPGGDREALRRAGRTLYVRELSLVLPRPSVSALGVTFWDLVKR